MSNRAELLDMAVHAFNPLMQTNKSASAQDLFDEALEAAQILIDKVDTTAAKNPEGPERDEIMDMSIHSMSALLNGRRPAGAEELVDEAIAMALSILQVVDKELEAGYDGADREELLDLAVHVQTALLSSRPKSSPEAVNKECVEVSKALLRKVDGA